MDEAEADTTVRGSRLPFMESRYFGNYLCYMDIDVYLYGAFCSSLGYVCVDAHAVILRFMCVYLCFGETRTYLLSLIISHPVVYLMNVLLLYPSLSWLDGNINVDTCALPLCNSKLRWRPNGPSPGCHMTHIR